MIKHKKLKPQDGFVFNYENAFIFPANEEDYMTIYGDVQYTFKDSEIEEIYEKINSIGCTSFQLSKEELLEAIEKMTTFKENNNENTKN